MGINKDIVAKMWQMFTALQEKLEDIKIRKEEAMQNSRRETDGVKNRTFKNYKNCIRLK